MLQDLSFRFGAIIEQKNDYKMEEQSWFLLRSTTYTKWIKFGKMRVFCEFAN